MLDGMSPCGTFHLWNFTKAQLSNETKHFSFAGNASPQIIESKYITHPK